MIGQQKMLETMASDKKVSGKTDMAGRKIL